MQRVCLAVVPRLVAWTLRLLGKSCQVDVRGQVHIEEALARYGRVILAFWHESMMLAAWHYRFDEACTLTSHSFDGELAARTVGCLGIGAVRGSSSEGGLEALSGLRKALDSFRVVGLTIDGPRGPRRVAKPGVAILSHQTGIPVVPYALIAVPAWKLRSWDQTMVPKFRARIVSVYGEPIPPRPGRLREAMEANREQIETSLNTLHQTLESEFRTSG